LSRPSKFSSSGTKLDGRVKPGHGEFWCLYPRSILRVYNAGMTTPLLIAALARTPRRCPRAIPRDAGGRGAKKSPHNFVAEASKKKAGAALGNAHAARRSAESVERHARMDALVQQTEALADAAFAAAKTMRLQRECLAALLAEPQR
jgi:hypothetical protein